MKREEQRRLKELKAELSSAEKKLAKPNGFQRSRDYVFCFVGDFLYWVDCKIDLSSIRGSIGVKSVLLDELFWDIFEIPENRLEQKSIHAWGAYTTHFYRLPERFEIALSDDVESAYAELINQAKAAIERYSLELRTVEDYRLLIKDDPNQKLNPVLADIFLGRTQEAREKLQDIIDSKYPGGFGGPKGTIFEYAIAYLEGINDDSSTS